MNNKHSLILESLNISKKSKSGKILESVSNNVRTSVEKFYKKQRTPSQVKKRINNVLNHIQTKCDKVGDNRFLGGSLDGGMKVFSKDNKDGTKVKSLPTIDEVLIQVRFLSPDVDLNMMYRDLFDSISKDLADDLKDSSFDSFSITLGIDITLDADEGYIVSIDRCSHGFMIHISHLRNPYVTEAQIKKVSTIKYFRGKNPWDKYKFEFSPYRNKKTGKLDIRVDMTNEYWDSHEYAFVSTGSSSLDDMYSYSKEAVQKVKNALKVSKYDAKALSDISGTFGVYEELDLENTPFIGKKKSYSEVEGEEDGTDDSKDSKDTSDDKEDPEESSTGVFGTEIGLPIDKENCESTGISGVATPTGKLGGYDSTGRKLVKRKVLEGMDSEDTKDLTLICPECDSQSINIRDSHVFHCAECGYEWKLTGESNRDTALDNTNDEPPLRKNNMSSDLDNMYTNPVSDPRFRN